MDLSQREFDELLSAFRDEGVDPDTATQMIYKTAQKHGVKPPPLYNETPQTTGQAAMQAAGETIDATPIGWLGRATNAIGRGINSLTNKTSTGRSINEQMGVGKRALQMGADFMGDALPNFPVTSQGLEMLPGSIGETATAAGADPITLGLGGAKLAGKAIQALGPGRIEKGLRFMGGGRPFDVAAAEEADHKLRLAAGASKDRLAQRTLGAEMNRDVELGNLAQAQAKELKGFEDSEVMASALTEDKKRLIQAQESGNLEKLERDFSHAKQAQIAAMDELDLTKPQSSASKLKGLFPANETDRTSQLSVLQKLEDAQARSKAEIVDPKWEKVKSEAKGQRISPRATVNYMAQEKEIKAILSEGTADKKLEKFWQKIIPKKSGDPILSQRADEVIEEAKKLGRQAARTQDPNQKRILTKLRESLLEDIRESVKVPSLDDAIQASRIHYEDFTNDIVEAVKSKDPQKILPAVLGSDSNFLAVKKAGGDEAIQKLREANYRKLFEDIMASGEDAPKVVEAYEKKIRHNAEVLKGMHPGDDLALIKQLAGAKQKAGQFDKVVEKGRQLRDAKTGLASKLESQDVALKGEVSDIRLASDKAKARHPDQIRQVGERASGEIEQARQIESRKMKEFESKFLKVKGRTGEDNETILRRAKDSSTAGQRLSTRLSDAALLGGAVAAGTQYLKGALTLAALSLAARGVPFGAEQAAKLYMSPTGKKLLVDIASTDLKTKELALQRLAVYLSSQGMFSGQNKDKR